MLDPLLQARLDSSALTAEHATALGLQMCTNGSLPKGLPRQSPAIEIPYFTSGGERMPFARYRFVDGGTPKYGQVKGSAPMVYLPPLLEHGRTWSDVLADPTEPLVITEGEFKAACGTVHVAPTVGLGGVWLFKRKDLELLPALAAFQWEGREVYIAFDSDCATNPQVLHARNALCEVLVSRGARPYLVHLPAAENGAKQGLDDLVAAMGAEALQACITAAEAWERGRMLHRLNEEVIYIDDPGCLVRRATGQKMSPGAFKDHAYATWTYLEEVTTKTGTRRVRVSAPKEWLTWKQRASAPRMVYEPGQPTFTPQGYNIWTGWGLEPQAGDTSLWQELLSFIFDGDAASIQWFETWAAYPLQNPGTKLYTATILWGRAQGTGKTLVGYTLGRLYGQNFLELKEEHLHNDFNFWAENRQFILGDEITGGGRGTDKRGMADRLKGMVTQSDVIVNRKHIDQFLLRDCINYLFTSNQPDAFFLEDQDRRFFVHEVRRLPKEQAWYDAYDRWYKSEAGAGAVFHRLLHDIPTKAFNPRAPAPMTGDKQAMIDLGKSDLAQWVTNLQQFPDETLQLAGTPMPWVLWTAQELLLAYDPHQRSAVKALGMSRELSKQGFRQASNGDTIRTKDGHKRLWAIRTPEVSGAWGSGEAARQYNRERR